MKVWVITYFYFWEDVDPVSEIIAFYQDEQDENEVCYRNRDHMISIVSYEVLS